jgi:hypothetical protein
MAVTWWAVGATTSNMGSAVHKVGRRCSLRLAASGLANRPMAWTLCTAIIDEGGGMVGGYQNEKGTHPIRQGGKAFAPTRGEAL